MFTIRTGDAPEVEAFLVQRIYEYNATATGYDDGESFSALHKTVSGAIEAGTCGYTWGGCCYVSYLWVAQSVRRKGIGAALLRAVERHARAKQCRLILLATHEFQAPGFYSRLGYIETARVADHPVGFASMAYVKRLTGAAQ
ncbi:GNAT family N-acetyltransferase [Rudaea sp.]|uniref:GNAT family N-acetyltransferase n=1 Tax=Rudaea sp. TaxID=2136325 RepID=UPI00321FED15